MKIEDVRIGMKLHNPHANRTGNVVRIEQEGELVLRANGLTWDEYVEKVELVREFRVGDRVRQIGPSELGFTGNMGQIGTITHGHKDGTFDVTWGNGHGNTMLPASIERVGPCESCEMAPVITNQCKQIAELQNALEGRQPLREVAKCYIQVEPERLLLSQNARRIIEFLTAMDTPVAFYRIAEGLNGMISGTAIIDGLIEAREAGIVRLDDGKYSIVRE